MPNLTSEEWEAWLIKHGCIEERELEGQNFYRFSDFGAELLCFLLYFMVLSMEDGQSATEIIAAARAPRN